MEEKLELLSSEQKAKRDRALSSSSFFFARYGFALINLIMFYVVPAAIKTAAIH